MNAIARKHKQNGMSFIGLLIVAGFLGFFGILGAQAVPTVIEFQSIKKAALKAANEGATPADVRRIFDKSQAIDDFKAISGKDLDVTKQGDKVVVSFAYNKEIHIGGPAYLVLKYAATTAK
jgi:preprotein translocase subunit SecF